MNQDKQAALMTSEEAAAKNFSTDNKISGGCSACGCEVIIHYYYDSGRPVPNAPFVLIDSNGTEIHGKTDANGLCHIFDMGCNGYEVLLDEGDDEFQPRETVENNPVLQASPDYAVLAGEYFTLFLLLHKQGLLEYDADDSDDNTVDIDNTGFLGGIFSGIPPEYRQAYDRFWELDKKINAGSIELKRAINKIHQSQLAAEVADKSEDTSAAVLLVCEIALGFIPVVGQALDVYAIGEWGWRSYKEPAKLNETLHIAEGALCAIGVIPGLGDALKVSGRAIIRALKEGSPEAIQFAIRVIRGLSDGNLVKGLTKLRGELRNYGAQAKALLQNLIAALKKMLAGSQSKGGWMVAMMKDSIVGIIKTLDDLLKKFDAALTEIESKITEFIGKVVTRKSGSAHSKSAQNKTEDTNAGRSKDEATDADTKAKDSAQQKDEQLCTTESVCKNDPVDVATGYVVDWRTDAVIDGSLPVAIKRYYRSGGERYPGLLGRLWRSEWDMRLSLSQGVITLLDGEFNQAIFASPEEGEDNRSPSNPVWRLGRHQGRLVLRHRNGLRYGFGHSCGKTLFLTSIEDAQGNRVSLLWERGTLRWLALPDGCLIHVETERKRITSLTLCTAERRPVRQLATYTYDRQGYLTGVRAGDGRNFDYRYSPEGWLLRWSDLAQTWVEHDYDEKGRATLCRAAEGYWTGHFSYDDASLTTHYHNGFGGVTSFVRDERNNILFRREADGGETHYEWKNNQLIAETDPLGNCTEYQRNDWGQVTAVTLPDGAVHRYEYDDDGQLLAYTDPLGSVWQYQRNAQGQLIEVNDPEGREWLHSYTAQGQLETIIGPDGVLQRYRYNARGLLSGIERDHLPVVRFFYDEHDRLMERHIARAQGVQVRRWEYEGLREAPAKVTYEDGTETRFGYDVEGNLTSVTDALGQRYRFHYGAFDNLLEATDPLGATVRYHYNAEAEFAGVTNSQNREWRYKFDESGRLNEERHYDGRTYRYGYDVAGRLTRRKAPDGSELCYEHDATGRVVTLRTLGADGAEESVTALEYDLAGRLTKAVNADASVEYAYNRAGQVVSERVNGEEIRSGYDESGRRAVVEGLLAPLNLQWASGRLNGLGIGQHQALSFSHTDSGHESLRSNGAGFALRQEWGDTGLLRRQALVNGDGRVNDVLERRYEYDALDRLTGIADSHWGEQAFRLNGVGQVTAERRSGRWRQGRLFGYDSEQNLCEIASIAPRGELPLSVKDAVPQSLSRYDAAGRVTQRGHTTYRYDDCGRLVYKREERPGFRPKETYFEWDVQDRLVRVLLPQGERWRYRYDAFGRRISKVREGQLPSAQAVARVDYRWDGDQLAGQCQVLADGTAAREVQWVYEPGSFRPLAQVEAKGEATRLHYIVTDVAGTARELCSEAGDVHWRGEQGLWDGYREERIPIPIRRYLGDAANEEVYCELRYQGQIYDRETGLYYNRHRYYDAEGIQQYISPDPIGLDGGIRPQSYVHNPLTWIDPLGLAKTPPLGSEANPFVTSRAARREAMRQAKIPTSQQPISQSKNASGWEYRYEVPKSKGGGMTQATVQQQTMDVSHPDKPHWEAGKVKVDPNTGETRMNDYGRPKIENPKGKAYYKKCPQKNK